MEPRMTPEPARVAALTALDRALADPVRLVRILVDAADPEDGAARVAAAFALTAEQGRAVCDNALATLTRARREAIAAELADVQTPWGPPLHVTATVRAGTATVDLDGREWVATGGRRADRSLQELGELLVDEVARPRRQPVVVAIPGGVRMVALPDGSLQFDRPGDQS